MNRVCVKTTHRRQVGGVRHRGAVAVLVAVSLVFIFSMLALVIDLSFSYKLHAEMQRSMDAAALAGASGLSSDDTSHAAAYARAYQFAAANSVDRKEVTEIETNVTIGHWEAISQTFTPEDGTQTRFPNAVRTAGKRGNIGLFFAPVIGVKTTGVHKLAVAVASGNPCGGVWGLEGISGTGSITTDSYDSTTGSYGSGGINQNGDLCSCQDLDLRGGVDIHGDAMYAEGYDMNISGSSHEVWGYLGEHSCDEFAAPVGDVEAASFSNDNDKISLTDREFDPFRGSPYDLRLGSFDNLTLQPGDYYFTSVDMAGSATITVTGPTRIYISGPANFAGGGFINSSQDPHDLTIYSTGSTMSLTGTAGFAGAVIAPETDITLVGNSEYYGTIIGRTVDIQGNSIVHVDESIVYELLGGTRIPVLVE